MTCLLSSPTMAPSEILPRLAVHPPVPLPDMDFFAEKICRDATSLIGAMALSIDFNLHLTGSLASGKVYNYRESCSELPLPA